MITTIREYETYLNQLSGDVPPDGWDIGGKVRDTYRDNNQYGTALRKFDMDAFIKRYNAFRLREIKRIKNQKTPN